MEIKIKNNYLIIVYSKLNLFLLIFFLKYNLKNCQIYDDFTQGILETGNYNLIDITDYQNQKIFVTTSKKIFKGIPPTLISTTTAKLINTTSIITLNQKYLLAACLEDSLLTKININNGESSSLLNYSEIEQNLPIPITICSLSAMGEYVYIGYSKIEYYSSQTNKTNIIINIKLENYLAEPFFDLNFGKKIVNFKSTIKTDSSRQISCEPLKYGNSNNFRLVCIYEDLKFDNEERFRTWRYFLIQALINEEFTNILEENTLGRSNITLGFKLNRLNESEARCMMWKTVYIIRLKDNGNFISNTKGFNDYKASLDLFDYQSDFFFYAEKVNFMNISDIFYIAINRENKPNIFKFYDYQENSIEKLVCKYNQDNYMNIIFVIYQCSNKIKYISLAYKDAIFNLGSYSAEIQLKSFEHKEFNANSLLDLSNLGFLGVESILKPNVNQTYGIDFYNTLMENNVLVPEKSFHTNYKYYLSLIEHNKNIYTRIYSLKSFIINVKTCDKDNCVSCWDNYYTCDNCGNGDYALLKDNTDMCYKTDKIIKGYKYDSNTKYFEKCYSSCEFCSKASNDINYHYCESCSEGYLFSYSKPGNCYINNLDLEAEKIINSANEKFISSTCSNNKINSTGECINECPNSSQFYDIVYDESEKKFISKNNLNPPKYLFNQKCLEECPSKTSPDSNTNKCKCQRAFHIENDITTCYDDLNCINDIYPYQNKNTNECYSSLSQCNYFFNKDCYESSCPAGKISLFTQNDTIKNYYKNNLLLENNLINKICICDINEGVWSNITSSSNENYFQECLRNCPTDYEPEPITKQCIEKVEIQTTIIKNPTTIIENPITIIETPTTIIEKPTTIIENPTTNIENPTTVIKVLATEKIVDTTEETEKRVFRIVYPDEYYINPDNCPAVYENKCFSSCPSGTCLTQQDPNLVYCIKQEPNVRVFNGICFENIDIITNNIKEMSDNKEIISNDAGVTIRAYSTKNTNEADDDASYSVVNLGNCENKIREYYHLDEDTELFILGIDSPNKDKSAITRVYNYEIYLANGTYLDHSEACKDTKISISSAITNPDLINLDKASYFNDLGYDIYNDSSPFYTDNCAPASIDGNDITLEDRKKFFSTSNVSLCNASCKYSSVDFNSKRFTCDCDIVFNETENNEIEEENEEEEDDSSYLDYFLSLVNYKIGVCYDLFYDFKSYYYNAGFYIAVGTFILCLVGMLIFMKWGVKDLNAQIFENIPSNMKLKMMLKEKMEKIRDLEIKKNNPPRKIEKSKSLYLNIKKNNIKPVRRSRKQFMSQIINNINSKNKNNGNIIDVDDDKTKNSNPNSLKNIKRSKRNLRSKSIKNCVNQSQKRLNAEEEDNLKPNNSKKLSNFLKKTVGRKRKKSSSFHIKNTKNTSKENLNDNSSIKRRTLLSRISFKTRKAISGKIYLFRYLNDDEIDIKELNNIPYGQALRIDNRTYFQMFLSFLFHEIQIVDIFYYRNPFTHLSIILSIYIFELCLDLTLNCLLYTDDVVSEKYNNNGSIKFFTTLSLSFMSNIFAGIIAYIVGQLAEYSEFLEIIIKDVVFKQNYFLNIVKFKKYLVIKLTFFYILQTIINFGMCYYLMIFCTIYHKTQGSIMINYIVGIAESMAISFGLTLIGSLLRYLSLKNRWKNIYNTSKFMFQKF